MLSNTDHRLVGWLTPPQAIERDRTSVQVDRRTHQPVRPAGIDRERLTQHLQSITDAASASNSLEAKTFLERVTEWEVGLYAHRMKQLITPVDVPADPRRRFTAAAFTDYLRRKFPDARLIAGATELGLDITKRYKRFSTLISVEAVPELTQIESTDSEWHIGAAATLTQIEEKMADEFHALGRMMRVFGSRQIRNRVSAGRPRWIWAVHCETSTGVLNDLTALKQLADEFKLKLCMDCISSVGTVPVDLQGVHLASCVSGKGLGAFPGLSMVFYNHALAPAPDQLPRYLDLGFYAAQEGIPFTHSSNLLFALQTAVRRIKIEERFPNIVELSVQLRARLIELGYSIVASHEHSSPAVLTLALPAEMSSKTVGWQLQKAGYLLSYRSEYLLKRNWIQICLMGETPCEKIPPVVNALKRVCSRISAASAPAQLVGADCQFLSPV